MHVVIVGCGRVGSALATRLSEAGATVGVIDEVAAAFDRLDERFQGQRVEGHALDRDALIEAGMERADACVVTTNGDNTNIVVGQIAKRHFNTSCVVVRILDPARAAVYKQLGLHTICPTSGAIDDLADVVLAGASV